jgi:hypothetical protein
MVSPTPVKIIALPVRRDPPEESIGQEEVVALTQTASPEDDWSSQLPSGRALAWTVDALVVIASLLLFTFVFLSVTREAPPWPLATVIGMALMMAAMYWGFFRVIAGGSLGAKLAQIAAEDSERDPDESRFR